MEWSFEENDVQQAKDRAQRMGKLRQNWNGFDSVVTGFIGEIVFCKVLQDACQTATVTLADTHDYDVIVKRRLDDSCGTGPQKEDERMRIEIKTRRTRCRTRPGFINCVSGHNFTQQTDIYVFLRVMYTGTSSGKVFYSGACTRTFFHKTKTFAATGSRVGTLSIKHDCFWIPVHSCVSFGSLHKEILRFTKLDENVETNNNKKKTFKRKLGVIVEKKHPPPSATLSYSIWQILG